MIFYKKYTIIYYKKNERKDNENMEPIINPSLFYWAEVFDAIRKIGLCIFCVGIVGAFIIGISFVLEIKDQDKSVINFYKKLFLMLIIIVIICVLIIIFIPTKETIYAMGISEIITPDNIDAITEKGEKGVKFIFEQIEQLINNTAATS